MDVKRKRELLNEYKNRRPEMGVISFSCKATGEVFLGISKDTKADFNSGCFKLSTGTHPNRRLQELWKQHGEHGFALSVVRTLPYDDPLEDQTPKLEELREQCLLENPQAERIWR